MSEVHISYGADLKKCRFEGACYGEICIAYDLCFKDDKDLTDEDKKQIKKLNDYIRNSK